MVQIKNNKLKIKHTASQTPKHFFQINRSSSERDYLKEEEGGKRELAGDERWGYMEMERRSRLCEEKRR
jgi:hypothetical protein